MAVATAQAYTKAGTKATTPAKLDKAVFGVEAKNHELLKAAYTGYLANGRDNLAVTKTRGLVRGGGKKPWRQKGTGRARFGSSRVPIWRGGGITFGPTGQENYSKQLNTKAKRLALRQALSMAASEDRIKVIESVEAKDGKVSTVAKLMKKVEATGNVLLIVAQKDEAIERATHNLTDVKAVSANYVNVYDLVNADVIVVDKPAIEIIVNWLTPAKVSPSKEAK